MDKDTSKSSDSVTADSSTPKTPTSVAPPSPSPPQSSDTPQNHQFSANFTKLYHSIFPPKSPVKDSFPVSPSPCSSTSSPDDHQETSNNCSDGTTSTTTTIENRLRQASFVLEYQQLCERYDLCCTHLQDLTDELESLRLDNATLRAANKELAKLLSLSSQSAMQNCLRRLSLLDSSSTGSELATDELSGYSPTSVMDQCRFERKNPERVGLPKSISVRSSSYLKSNQPSTPNNSSSGPARNQLRSRVPRAHDVGKQMYLPGAKEAFEVYNQGMFKTELCNKWQETGACPYGDQCQFAHGIAELRPVIRHPRYKTEVCRMVLAGDSCPYGHRCHFRHSLTEQEMRLSPR